MPWGHCGVFVGHDLNPRCTQESPNGCGSLELRSVGRTNKLQERLSCTHDSGPVLARSLQSGSEISLCAFKLVCDGRASRRVHANRQPFGLNMAEVLGQHQLVGYRPLSRSDRCKPAHRQPTRLLQRWPRSPHRESPGPTPGSGTEPPLSSGFRYRGESRTVPDD